MIETIALFLGYAVMVSGGVAIAIAIAWLCMEFLWRRYGDYKLLRDYFVWKRDNGGVSG
jgi:hypothetical protein